MLNVLVGIFNIYTQDRYYAQLTETQEEVLYPWAWPRYGINFSMDNASFLKKISAA